MKYTQINSKILELFRKKKRKYFYLKFKLTENKNNH